MTTKELYEVLLKRKTSGGQNSYTASLFDEGLDRIIQKVGEESVEVVIAAKNDDISELIGEVADLYYHLNVLLIAKGVTIEQVEARLSERHADKTNKESQEQL